MRFSPTARSYQALAAIVALFLMSGTALAAATSFGSITVGKNDKNSQIQLQGPILNPGKYPDGKQRPVNISDNLALKGDLMILAGKSIKAEGSNSLNLESPLYVADDASFYGKVSMLGPVTMANVTTTGTLDIRGALVAGQYNVGTTITSNAGLTNRLSEMIRCVGNLSSLGAFVESDDYIFCFNNWMAGQPGSVTIASQTALTDVQRAEVEAARIRLSGDPVLSMSSGFAPLK